MCATPWILKLIVNICEVQGYTQKVKMVTWGMEMFMFYYASWCMLSHKQQQKLPDSFFY